MDHRQTRDGSKLQDRGLNERHRSSLLEEDARLWIRIRGSCHSLILGGRTVADESSVTTTERSRHPQQHSRSNCPPAKLATVKPVGRNDPCPCRSGHRFKQCCGRPPSTKLTSLDGTYLRLQISLRHSAPEVWRHILLRADERFEDLHQAIQACGWEQAHLWHFVDCNRVVLAGPPNSGSLFGKPEPDAGA